MDSLEFIKKTPSDELYKHHLKEVFKTYHELFGEVCTGCPTKITGYISRIKNYNKSDIMTSKKPNFILRGQSVILVPGSSKVYSNANLTDEVAIAFLKKNENRKALFSKVPDNLNELISGDEGKGEKALKDYTVKELKELYPQAKGEKKADLIKDIQSIINEAAVNAEAEETEKDSKNSTDEEE